MPTINVTPESGEELQEIADALAKSKKVVVITGAGISTNCGIPDFRSENGLYALIQAQYDAAAATSTSVDDSSEERPSKRRCLTRSASAADLKSRKSTVDAPRQLRSSTSFREDYRSDVVQPSLSNNTDESVLTSSQSSRSSSRQSLANNKSFSSSQSSQSSGRQSLPNLKGKDLFDSMIWTDSFTTSIFYTFISTLRKKVFEEVTITTKTHKFLRTLRDSGRLVRVYTQNIDGLEAREGLEMDLHKGPGVRNRFGPRIARPPKVDLRSDGDAGAGKENVSGGGGINTRGVEVVPLHGGLESLRCGLCERLCSWDEHDRHQYTLAGMAPDCPHCTAANATREHKGRRSLAIGRLRPDVVLYGEEHPCAHQIGPLITHDISLSPEVLLILGTSLRVHGLKVMVREFAKAIHNRGGKVVFVNITKPPDSIWGEVIDYWVESDCDWWVDNLKERREDLWQLQGYIEEKETKPKTTPKNPQSTRPDTTSGAYQAHKIHRLLRELMAHDAVQSLEKTFEEQQLVDSQLIFEATSAKKRKKSTKIQQDRQTAALTPETTTSVRNVCEKELSRQLPVLPGLSSWRPRPPLTAISTNRLPGRRSRKSSLRGQPHLPTPPLSDEAPETPSTPTSIRTRMSITNLLSSPLQG